MCIVNEKLFSSILNSKIQSYKKHLTKSLLHLMAGCVLPLGILLYSMISVTEEN